MIRDNNPFGYGPTWDIVKVEIGPRLSIVESGRIAHVAAELADQFMAEDSPKAQYIAFQSNGQAHFDPDDGIVLLYRIVGENKVHQMRGPFEALLVKAWQLRFHARTWLINAAYEPARPIAQNVPKAMLIDGLGDIAGLCVGYDGFHDVTGLKSLIDDIAEICDLVAKGKYDEEHRLGR